VIAAAGGASLGAALLAACGGDSGEPAGGGEEGLVVKPVDTLKQAKRGGTFKNKNFASPASLDVLTPNNPITPFAYDVYRMLVHFEPGYMKASENELGGSLAESWEISPDGLQITLKLRQGVKWHNKPPVNGRAFDMEDVLFSWQRFADKASQRVSLVNSVNPAAPVLSLTKVDNATFVMKLKEPVSWLLGQFVMTGASGVVIVPRETDSTLDLRHEMIGTGPWYLDSFQSDVSLTLKRNPEYWDKDEALMDVVEQPIIGEYATALAQLKAGNIYWFGTQPPIRGEDILPVKREQPLLSIYQDSLTTRGSVQAFGWLPEGQSPFLDERVRQAVSMAIDRDLFIDATFNVSQFAAEGMPMETRWSTALAATFDGWWLDPKSKDFGPNAKYYQHNVAEAKKLMAAAGHPDGFHITSHMPGREYAPAQLVADIVNGMAQDIGISVTVHQLDYLKEYIPNFRDGRGQWEGWAWMSTAGGDPTGGDGVGALASVFWSKAGSAYKGFSVSGRNDQAGDPQVDALIERGRREQDLERRKEIGRELQRYLAKTVYMLQPPGGATGFTLAWPCIGNFNVWQGSGLGRNYHWWVDETKPPFKSA
jgi:ABC-type transport system substrate-binding protein